MVDVKPNIWKIRKLIASSGHGQCWCYIKSLFNTILLRTSEEQCFEMRLSVRNLHAKCVWEYVSVWVWVYERDYYYWHDSNLFTVMLPLRRPTGCKILYLRDALKAMCPKRSFYWSCWTPLWNVIALALTPSSMPRRYSKRQMNEGSTSWQKW